MGYYGIIIYCLWWYVNMKPQDIVYKMSSPAGMAALIEEHADAYGGADRLAVVLDEVLPAEAWNALAHRLSDDLVSACWGASSCGARVRCAPVSSLLAVVLWSGSGHNGGSLAPLPRRRASGSGSVAAPRPRSSCPAWCAARRVPCAAARCPCN